MMHYQYTAAVFDGERSFSGLGEGDTRICSVIACTGASMDTCGRRFPVFAEHATAVFDELTIIAEVPTPEAVPQLNAKDSAYFPLSMDVSIMPLEVDDYVFTEEQSSGRTVYTFTLMNLEKELYTFAVWGRVYPPVSDSSVIQSLSKLLLLIALCLRLI